MIREGGVRLFSPDYYAHLENRYLRKYCSDIGVHRVKPHSFRHMRITHLVHSDDHQKDWGSAGPATPTARPRTTIQTVFDRQPFEDFFAELELLDVLDVK